MTELSASHIVISWYNRLLFFNHSSALWTCSLCTCRKPGSVFSERFLGPIIIMPIVAAGMSGDRGNVFPSSILAMLFGSSQYIDMLPFTPLFRMPLSQNFAPFTFGKSLTMCAAGKYHATNTLSGSVSTSSSCGISPIHILLASEYKGT